jgi:GNAT superfamily N-acetyltransferase
MPKADAVLVRRMTNQDLPEAERIFRVAFGTFLGMPDPTQFAGESRMVESRWLADPSAALTAEVEGQVAGSNFVTNWGSVGFFGPLTVRPDLWDLKIGQRLLESTMDIFGQWGTRHAGLFTFPHSTKHLHLYQRFGFWPRFLTSIMSKPVSARGEVPSVSTYSAMARERSQSCLEECAEVSNAVYEGLDLRREILAVDEQGLGDTVLLPAAGRLEAFAVCHWGPRSEADRGEFYIKFAGVRPGPRSEPIFRRLLDQCETLASARGMERLSAGVNTGRHAAYRVMLGAGFRAGLQGVTMHRPNEVGYDSEDNYVLDDWR